MILSPPDLGTTFQLGPYTIRISLRTDNPAFASFLIFRGDALIGKQFSRPCETDCQRLEHQGEHRAAGRGHDWLMLDGGMLSLQERRDRGNRKRGRPRKDQSARELQEALES